MVKKELSYNVTYRNVRYARIEFRAGNLHLVIPRGYDYKELVNKKAGWIKKKQDYLEHVTKTHKGRDLEEKTVEELKLLVHDSVNHYSKKIGVSINNITFRKSRSKWASINTLNNISINKYMRYLPSQLISYIVFHELAHIIVRNHSRKFWKIIENEFGHYSQYENELYYYWMLISKRAELI